jgi:hypothetical protein
MKLLLENWRKYLTEDWQDTYWKTDDGKKITIGDVVDEVLDGNHRLQKAFEQGEPLKARVLDLDNPETPEVFKRMFG